MRAGRLVEEGATATLIVHPREAYTQTLLANTLRVRRPAEATP